MEISEGMLSEEIIVVVKTSLGTRIRYRRRRWIRDIKDFINNSHISRKRKRKKVFYHVATHSVDGR